MALVHRLGQWVPEIRSCSALVARRGIWGSWVGEKQRWVNPLLMGKAVLTDPTLLDLWLTFSFNITLQ